MPKPDRTNACPTCGTECCQDCGACPGCGDDGLTDAGLERLLAAVFGEAQVLTETELRQLSKGDLARLQIIGGKVH